MLFVPQSDLDSEIQAASPGEILLNRSESAAWAFYLESGCVALGVLQNGVMEHQFGVAQGPCWLEASCLVLGLPYAVDAVAESKVTFRCLPINQFRSMFLAMPTSAQTVLHDVAAAHRQQTELAISRLAKDADSRCAEWLLQHAQTGEKGTMTVQLQQRKRCVAAQLGIAPETLSRVLRHLRERSLINVSGRVVNVVDPDGLRMLAGV